MYNKTIICDIDGTLFYNPSSIQDSYVGHEILPGTKEKLNEWHKKEYFLILMTSRPESMRKVTEKQLEDNQIWYDLLVMGVNKGPRIVINDINPNHNEKMAIEINIKRDEGIKNLEI